MSVACILSSLRCDLPGLRARHPGVFWATLYISSIIAFPVAPAASVWTGTFAPHRSQVSEFDLRPALGHALAVPLGWAACGLLGAAVVCAAAALGGFRPATKGLTLGAWGILLGVVNGFIAWGAAEGYFVR